MPLEYGVKMLHEFLTSNRGELIERCRAKVAKRFAPEEVPLRIDHGVPLFLQQLVDTLRTEQITLTRGAADLESTSLTSEIGRAAAAHGSELLSLGFSIDQVVHEYGDVCQSVTELAIEENMQISNDEFRTLNRCLDDAIADAVTSFGKTRRVVVNDQTEDLRTHLVAFTEESRRLIEIAIHAFTAIRTGNVGLAGATSSLLVHTLTELKRFTEQALNETQRLCSRTELHERGV
jgi:polyhydroxyalkanoate synthesis regulator protein